MKEQFQDLANFYRMLSNVLEVGSFPGSEAAKVVVLQERIQHLIANAEQCAKEGIDFEKVKSGLAGDEPQPIAAAAPRKRGRPRKAV